MFRRLMPVAVTFALLVAAAPLAAAEKAKPAEFPLADAVECHARGGLPNFFAKLEAGGDVRIGYLGGSITAQEGWRPKTRKYFQTQFPKAKVSEINAAIGGTGSDLGAYRVRHDVLDKKPDLVFVEFAVNDGGTDPDQIVRCMEGIVRQTWKADPATDICFVYTVTDTLIKPLYEGKYPRAASVMETVAEHYGIPSIHMAMEVAKQAKAGTLLLKHPKPVTDEEKKAVEGKTIFASDGVHPHPETGHELYLAAVVRSMEKFKAVAAKPAAHALPAPMAADNWENAKMVPLSAANPTAGWQKLDPATVPMAKSWTGRMGEFWKAEKPGARFTFKFKGTAAAIYGLLGPDGGRIRFTVDDQPPAERTLFDHYCTGHRLAAIGIAKNLPDAVHTVTVELTDEPVDKAKIFKDAHKEVPDIATNPKYSALNAYAGAILLVGELVAE